MNRQWHRGFKLKAVVLVALAILSGCGQTHSLSTSSSKKPTSHEVKSSKKASVKTSSVKSSSSSSAQSASSQSTQPQTLWSTSKDHQLKAYIDQWGPTMGQTYTEYDGHTPLKTSVGTTYPEVLNHITIQGPAGTIGWSADGNGQYDYNVVAIYNYDGTHAPLPNHITYVFAFYHQAPFVLVDQSRDGSPTLTQTQNTEIKAAFEKIANGDAAATTTNSQKLDAKTIGVLLMAQRGDDIVKDNMLHFANNTAIYPYIIDSSTADSQVPYRVSGSQVTYGIRDPNYTTSENVFIPHTVSLQALEVKYYHTATQIKTVKQVVARLQTDN